MRIEPQYIKLGMTQLQIYNIAGGADDALYDIWSNSTGPNVDNLTWEYKPHVVHTLAPIYNHTGVEDQPRKAKLYFRDGLLLGYDIYPENTNLPLTPNPDTLPKGNINIGDTKEMVTSQYGVPGMVYPQAWDELDNPEVWEFRDKDGYPYYRVEFTYNIVTAAYPYSN